MKRQWRRHPLGWTTEDFPFIYRGDFRLRLETIKWQWHGLNDRRWHIWFRKVDISGGAIHRSFTVALVVAIWNTYRNYWRRA